MPANCIVCGSVCETRCSRCHAVWYCGVEHQTADWPSHKQLCARLQAYYVKQLPTSFTPELRLARHHMPRTYYAGYRKALANLSAATFNSPLSVSAWADRLKECETQCIEYEDDKRYRSEIGPQSLELAVRIANQRIAATQILGSSDDTTSSYSSSVFQSRTALALERAEKQAQVAAEQWRLPYDAMCASELLAPHAPTAYYCGVFDAHCSMSESLMEEQVALAAQRGNDMSTIGALAMCGVALMVCKQRIRESLASVATRAADQKLQMLALESETQQQQQQRQEDEAK